MSDRALSADCRESSRSELKRGMRDIAPIVAATVPFGLVFGTIASHHGMSLGDGTFMSAAIFAGAAQFAALELWTHPLPVLAVLLAVMAVNLRLLLYSAAIGRRIDHWPSLARYLGLAIISDPIFALAELTGGPRVSTAHYFGLAVPLYLNWVVTTAVGFVLGNRIGDPQAIGLDFVVVAYFIHILMGFRSRPNALAVIAMSAGGSVAAYLTAGPPWHIAAGALVGMATAVALARPNRGKP